jgi:hypothetical protein
MISGTSGGASGARLGVSLEQWAVSFRVHGQFSEASCFGGVHHGVDECDRMGSH